MQDQKIQNREKKPKRAGHDPQPAKIELSSLQVKDPDQGRSKPTGSIQQKDQTQKRDQTQQRMAEQPGALDMHYLVMQSSRQVGRVHMSRTAKINLDPGQPKILQCLYEKRGNTPKEIAAWCVLDKSSTTTVLKLMEQKGLIEKKPSLTDRRSCTIELTPFGLEQALQVLKIGQEVDRIILEGFSEEEKAILSDFLARMSANAKKEMEK